jgi:hypothetical protein
MGMKRMLLVLAALGLIACSGDDGASEPTSDPQIHFQVSFVDAQSGAALSDVQLCVPGHDDVGCVTSDASGHVELDLPKDAELMLRCESPSHGPAYMTWALGKLDIDAGKFGLLAKNSQNTLLLLAGATDTANLGAITVNVYTDLVNRDERVPGGTATLSPATGIGPVYISDQKLPVPALTAMTVGGPALFVDVAPGDAVVTFAHPTLPCEAGFGWPTDDPLSLATQVFAGGISNVTFVCPH